MLKKREILQKENSSLKNAVFINAFSRYATIIINIGFSAVLARILTPEDYGMTAVMMVFINFFSLMADMGIGPAIIQNKSLDYEDYDNIYSFSVFLGIILCLLFIIFSYPMALFYGNIEFFKMGLILSISLLFNTVNAVPNALLMKNKLFMLMGIRTIVICVLYDAVSLVLAFAGLKYYSIVIGSAVQSFIIFAWNKSSTELHFRLRPGLASMKKVAGFSFFQSAFNTVNYFSKNMDNFLTGKYMGNEMLGYYDKAYRLMQYPALAVSGVITPALHPILSEYQGDSSFVYQHYIKISRFLMLAGSFISVYCFASSYEIIHILYGDRWDLAVPCLRWFSIGMWVQVANGCTGSFFQSMNKTNYLFITGLANSVLNIAAIIAGVMSGSIETLSMYLGAVSYLCFLFPFYFLTKKVFRKSIAASLFSFKKEFMIAAGLVICCIFYPFSAADALSGMVIKTVYYGAAYLVLLFCTGDMKFLVSMIR